MNNAVWHIRPNSFGTPLTAYCGAEIQTDPYVVAIYPREIKAWYSQGQVCAQCLESPEYAMYLLRGLDDE